jgi:predicted O-methyltransferase YrrM
MIDRKELDFCKQRSDHSAGFEYLYERICDKSLTLPKECPFLEIGTRAGGSALLMMEAIRHQDRVFVTVDPYGKTYKSGGDWPAIGEDTYRDTMKVLFETAWLNHITHVHYRMTSQCFMDINPASYLWIENRLIKEQYGVVYLDGEHVDSVVMAELNFFIPRMHDNGLIIIDDVSYIMKTDIKKLQDIMKIGYEDNNRLFIDVKKL